MFTAGTHVNEILIVLLLFAFLLLKEVTVKKLEG